MFLIQEFTKDLKDHLYPRVCKRIKVTPREHQSGCSDTEVSNAILIKDDRLYNHKLARFYHTTYDVRRSEDIVNPKTSHSNIMLLSDNDTVNNGAQDTSSATTHRFIYARVLGIYHVNVIYIGPGMKGYTPMRFDFLHVRWYQHDGPGAIESGDWTSLRLDRLSFPPIARKDSFGFIDPSLVLRTSHIIPAFDSGKRYADGIGLSAMAKDSNDWKNYYVNRYKMFFPGFFS